MMSMRVLQITAFVVMISTTAISVRAQPAREPASQPAPPEAITLLRRINGAQAQARQNTQRYLSIAEIKNSQASVSVQDWAPVDERTMSNARYRLRLVLSPKADDYTLHLQSHDSCGESYFTDSSGVIYLARALGCPAVK